MKNAIAHLAIIVIAATPALANAQSIAEMLRDTRLVESDRRAMGAAAAELYTAENAAVGDETIWQNTETGAHGTVEITQIEGNCVDLRHLARASNARTNIPLEVRWCNEDGSWVNRQR